MKVIVGISGGVDSSVAAWKLLQKGYEVEGLFMKNWHDKTGLLHGDCPHDDDKLFAEMVASKLGIKLHYIDLSKEYRKRVVDYMFDEYAKGRTPNPDVLCNREIKFDAFLEAALNLGADYVATGHYCRKDIVETKNGKYYRLLAGKDGNKDQSYFLCQLNQKQIEKALFPIGEMQKSEVRQIAAEFQLATAERKDSQGICFVGKVDLPVFLQQKLEAKEGEIIEIPRDFFQHDFSNGYPTELTQDLVKKLSNPYFFNKAQGEVIGKHKGAHFYTIGQRKGINIGGKPLPLFVLGIDVEKNLLFVGQGADHPGLLKKALFIKKDEIHWVRPDLAIQEGQTLDCKIRIRYRQPLQKGKLVMYKNGLYVVFEELQKSITQGQFASWYIDDELIGSGVIS